MIDSILIAKKENTMFYFEKCYDIDELMRRNMHIHTNFSGCAKPEMTLEAIVREAERCGLTDIAITDHSDIWMSDHTVATNEILKQQRDKLQTNVNIRIGAEMMACIVLFNAVFAPIEVFGGTMRGTGYSVQPTLIMCICVCLIRVLWVVFVAGRWHTIRVLCMAYPITWILCAIIFFIVYLKGDWLHSRIQALGMTPEK